MKQTIGMVLTLSLIEFILCIGKVANDMLINWYHTLFEMLGFWETVQVLHS